jgi:superfamily I DNA and/or RNA helicase
MNNIERALRKARSRKLRTIAEDIETLADYMKTGFKETLERIERLEELTIAIQEHGKRLI